MWPSDIRFIQSDVSQYIDDGRDMLDVFKQLVRGEIRAGDMGDIEVVRYERLHYAYDGNRRLLLFKVRTCTCVYANVGTNVATRVNYMYGGSAQGNDDLVWTHGRRFYRVLRIFAIVTS